MTDAVQLALIATIPPTLAALTGVAISLINGRQARANGKKADAIHDLANSHLTAVTESLKEANNKIESLQNLVSKLNPKSE